MGPSFNGAAWRTGRVGMGVCGSRAVITPFYLSPVPPRVCHGHGGYGRERGAGLLTHAGRLVKPMRTAGVQSSIWRLSSLQSPAAGGHMFDCIISVRMTRLLRADFFSVSFRLQSVSGGLMFGFTQLETHGIYGAVTWGPMVVGSDRYQRFVCTGCVRRQARCHREAVVAKDNGTPSRFSLDLEVLEEPPAHRRRTITVAGIFRLQFDFNTVFTDPDRPAFCHDEWWSDHVAGRHRPVRLPSSSRRPR